MSVDPEPHDAAIDRAGSDDLLLYPLAFRLRISVIAAKGDIATIVDTQRRQQVVGPRWVIARSCAQQHVLFLLQLTEDDRRRLPAQVFVCIQDVYFHNDPTLAVLIVPSYLLPIQLRSFLSVAKPVHFCLKEKLYPD